MPDPPPRRRGPIYDDAMKILAEDDLAAVLSLVGVHGPAEPLESPSAVSVELPASTRKAGAGFLGESPRGGNHARSDP